MTNSRYAIEEYKFKGELRFRVVDTFNGGKVIAKSFTRDTQAITWRDELESAQSSLRMRREEFVALSSLIAKV